MVFGELVKDGHAEVVLLAGVFDFVWGEEAGAEVVLVQQDGAQVGSELGGERGPFPRCRAGRRRR